MGYTTSQGAVISVSVDGAAASQRQIDAIAQSMGNLSNAVQNAMRNLAATAGIGGGLVQVVQLSDEYTKFASQLRLATQSQREYQGALDDVRRIAHDAQVDLASTGVLYARISNGTRELAIGQKQVADITEVVNLALRVSGATAEESASAQLQLSQAFASGTLRGEEFNAVNEAAPRLMRALADGIGVPVGALKQMASEGKITSEVMTAVLPKSLEQLRSEAQQVQTIGGAFTNLKNRVLEYTATSAQANGSVAMLTGSIGLLSNNLELMAGTLMTVTAVKAANWSAGWVTEIYRKIAADQAGRAATLAAAQADLSRVQATTVQAAATQAGIVVAREEAVARLAQANANILAANAAIEAATAAGAQSFALRTLRMATGELQVAEAARGAMLAELAVLGQQQARVSAQIAAARTAEAAATEAVAVAQTGGAAAAGLAGRALGLLGGPVGAIVTVLGLAATAWSVYGSKSEEANKKAAESTEASTPEIVANLEKQNIKLRERLDLMKQGMPELAKDSSPAAERLASTLGQINALVAKSNELKDKGQQLDAGDQAQLYALGLQYNNLTQAIQQSKGLKAQIDATGSALTDLIAVRERLSGVDKQYFEDLGKLQTAREKGAITEKEYIELVSKLATETYKKSEAGKTAISALNKEQDAYTRLVIAANEKISATALEASGIKDLTESQKLQIAFDEELRKGKLKLSPEHKKEYQALIDQLAVNEAVIASQKRAAQGAADYAKIIKEYNDAAEKKIQDAVQEADKNEELVRTFGLTKAAIEQVELARLQEQLTQHQSGAFTLEEIENLEKLIEAKKRSAAALASLETMEANKKALDQMVQDAKRSSEQISQALTDNIMRGGRNAADYLKDLFRTVVLRPILLPVGDFVGSTVTNTLGLSGPTAAAAGASGNSAITAAQAASNMYSVFKSGGTMEQSIAKGAQSLFDRVGLSMGDGAPGQAAQWAGKIGGTVGGYMIGSSINSMISGKYEVGSGYQTVEKIGTAIASYFGGPIGGAIAGAISGLVNRAFGMGPTEIQASGLRGTLSASSVTGESYQNLHQDGGWFRSDKNWTDTNALASDLVKQFTEGISAIETASTGFASSLGVQADWIKTYSKNFDLAMTGDAAKDQEAIVKLFGDIGDELARKLVPNLDDLSKSGETASAALERLANDFKGTDQIAQLLGFSASQLFGETGIGSAKAREQLIDLAGGLSVLSSEAQFFNQNFLTDAERIKPVAEALDKALASLGLSTIPTTRDQFKILVNSLIMSGAAATESGAKQLDSLLALGEAFAQVHPDDVAEKAQKAAAIMQERQGLQDQLDEMMMSSAQLLAKQRDALDESNRSIFDQIQGLKAAQVVADERKSLQDQLDEVMLSSTQLLAKQREALDESNRSLFDQVQAVKAQAAAVQAVKDAAGAMLGGVSDAFSALGKVVSREKSVLQISVDAHTAAFGKLQSLSQALHSTLDSLQSPEQKTYARAMAQAEIRADLAITKAGGVLSDVQTESLKKALGAVTQDASSLFSSYADYMRDLLQTQNDVAALADITDDSLSVEQRSLDALKDQLARLDDIVSNGRAQLDALNGQSIATLSLAQAMAAFQSSIGAAQSNPVVGGTSIIAGFYQDLLGRAPDQAGLKYWQDVLANGNSLDSIRQGFMGSDEYKKLHPFAVGTNFVPETMPALIHQGERIIPAADNRVLMSVLSRASSGDSAAVVAELKAVREELKAFREANSAENRGIAKGTQQAAEHLDAAINGDKPLATKVITEEVTA